MAKIQVMDEQLANMIAAGEVVERPSGVVKELVENALDAHASHIEIHIREGGMQEITIVDNGDGMDEQDLRNAFKRHSTSKVKQAYDLNHINTFGFRGEALPSIASVSITKANSHDGNVGHEITIDNGKEVSFGRFARNKGTTITVTQLFGKLPARAKYINNIRYEVARILEVVQKFAMSNPEVSFLLTNEGAESFRTYGTGNLKDVFLAVYGASITRETKAFSGETFDFQIKGLMALPQHNRANRYATWIYLNGRMIRSPKIHNAVIEAYRKYLTQNRYPIVVIDIIVDPQLADVNVHPSKWEVRLSKEAQVIQLILNTLEEQLNTTTVTPRVQLNKQQFTQVDFKKDLIESIPFVAKAPERESSSSASLFKVEEAPQKEYKPEPVQEALIPETPVFEEKQPEFEPRIEALTILAQMSARYILAQGDQGLYIIDQHAAMERIRYEYYQNKLLHVDYPTQELLIPVLLEGSQKAITRLEEIQEIFAAVQIDIEQLDDTTLIVRAIPVWIKDTDVKGFAQEILDTFDAEKTIDIEAMRRRSIATLACHSSIRFNEYLSMNEMTKLVEDLRSCEQPFHCPHGRPTLILMDHNTLEKEFKR